MFRGYWVAAVAFVLVCCSLPIHDAWGQEQNKAGQDEIYIPPPPFGIFEQPDSTDETTKPCENGKDNRNSDLCAQWKAADAAKESAEWTRRTFWLGVVGSIIGFFTLIAAGMAACYAKKAAEETKRGADFSDLSIKKMEEGLLRQIRPWLVGDGIHTDNVTDLTVGYIKYERAIFLYVNFSNAGQSPAINAAIFADHLFIDAGEEIPKFTANKRKGASTVGQGSKCRSGPRYIFGDDFNRFISSELDVIIFCRADYSESCAPDMDRFTETTYRCRYQGQAKNDRGEYIPNISVTIEGPQNVCT